MKSWISNSQLKKKIYIFQIRPLTKAKKNIDNNLLVSLNNISKKLKKLKKNYLIFMERIQFLQYG